MANVYNNNTGKWENIDDGALPSAIVSGSHSFPKGITVPMLDLNGNPAPVDSEKAGEAFHAGFTLATPAASDAAYQRQTQEAVKARMDSMGAETFGVNAINEAGFGLPMAAARAIGGQQAADAVNQADDANPIAAGAGKATGMVAGVLDGSSIIGAPTRLAVHAGEAATSIAGHVIENTLAKKAIAGAAEGAFFGAGSGITEASLGKPEDVVDNLVSNLGMGALFGGAGSLAFGAANAAKPFFQDVASKVIDRSADAVSNAATSATQSALKRALKLRGAGDIADAAGGLTADAINATETDAVQAGAKELAGSSKDVRALQKRQSQMAAGLKQSMDNMSDEAANVSKVALTAANNDAELAVNEMRGSYKEASNAFDEYKAKELSDQAPMLVPETRELLKTSIDNLKARASTAAEKDFVRELSDSAEINFGLPSKKVGAIDRVTSAADELTNAAAVQEVINKHYGGNHRGFTQPFGDEIKQTLQPGLRDLYEQQFPDDFARNFMKDKRTYYEAIDGLSRTIKEGGVEGLAADAHLATKSGEVLANISDFAPDLEKARLNATNAKGLQQTYADAYVKYNRMLADSKYAGEKLGYDEFKDVFKELTPPKPIIDKLDGLKAVQDTLATSKTLSPVDAAIMVKRALGHDVSNLEALAPNHATLELLSKIKGMQQGNGAASSSLSLGAAVAGHVPGLTMIRAAAGSYNDPYRLVKAIQHIEKVSQAGAQALDTAMRGASNAMLGKAVEKTATRAAIKVESQSMAEKRKNFNMIREKIGQLQNPQTMQQHLGDSMKGLEGVPNLRQATATKLMQATSYLSTQLPKDPMAGTSIFANKTNFSPSDAQVTKFLGQVDAVQNPIKVIDRIAGGRATAEEINALKTVHPGIYNKLQQNVIGAIMEHGEQIPYDKRLQVSQIFNTPADFSMRPQFIGSMQQNFVKKDPGGKPAQDNGGADPNKSKPALSDRISKATMSTSDSLTYRAEDQ